MAEQPGTYQTRFYYMPIWTVDNGVQNITVSNYLSTSTNKQGDKNAVWTKLQNFLRFGKNEETNIPFQQGEIIVDDRLQPHGRVKYSWAETLGPFNGKGTPDRYMRFLEVVSLWLAVGCQQKKYRPGNWKKIPSLQTFADKYMGVDCNSFVGGYFQTNYPATGWDTSVNWNKNGLERGPKRKSVSEIEPLDVLVQFINSKKKHVALIDKVWNKSGPTASVSILQSASSKDGLWGGNCTLEITSSGNGIISGEYDLDFNVGVFGVIGANS